MQRLHDVELKLKQYDLTSSFEALHSLANGARIVARA
jgi:hypothetical protein